MSTDAILPFFSDWFRFDLAGASPVVTLTAVVLCGWYLGGAIRLWANGRRWSIPRTISFVLGCALMFCIATFGVNRYASVSVTALMFQQITAMTVIPPLLIVGSPGRLLLRSTPRYSASLLLLKAALTGLRSTWARALLHPLLPIAIALVVFPGLYLTDGISLVMGSRVGADLLLAFFLLAEPGNHERDRIPGNRPTHRRSPSSPPPRLGSVSAAASTAGQEDARGTHGQDEREGDDHQEAGKAEVVPLHALFSVPLLMRPVGGLG